MPDASDTAAVVREIHKAAGRGDAGRLRALLRRHPGLANDTLAPSGPTPLLTAAGYGRLACVTALLEAGSTVEAADNMHGTELHYAAMRGHAHCLPTLLAAGADVEAVNSQRRTPLGVAAHGGHAGCAGADVNAMGNCGETALSCAASWSAWGSEASLRVLIGAGADASDANARGETPLHRAAGSGNEAAARVLLAAGAAADAADRREG
ncbi:hypothetical protein CHLNCDRAFT_134585 [Chlorella variabilis]|uniref:Uncharacterized protein n=1 Tax=Chlorella variabilis TaxID=554065 RepID=E1ZG91_CHLVA|nr:hypothetical protein CHLNCDRAFT_134585 [Chlorella variabilis]EFN55252.1 hypothetical protein CHLNCDRAFT_134585 [Chlorella variabilis]|eukprot:XP_005847354.1 hypothetical protein CHLNCDRAFT_134585 [Chlorella variabilis]